MRIIDAIIKSGLLFSLKGLAHAVLKLNEGDVCHPFVKWIASPVPTHFSSRNTQRVMMLPIISFYSEV